MLSANRYRLRSRIITTLILISLLYVVSNHKIQTTNYSIIDIMEDNQQQILPDSAVIKAASYIIHTSIFIDSDDDFITYGFNGTGSWTNPYIIENYNITTTDSCGIEIIEVSKSFVIQNCYIRASNYGILISNIFTNFSLNSNDCSDHSNSGIYTDSFSHTSKIENNICNNNSEGIRVITYQGIISNNTCNDNTNQGIYIESSLAVTISNNTCSSNDIGIYSFIDDSSNFINNLCTNNSIGLQVMSSQSSIISDHTLTNNSNYGLYLNSSETSAIESNTITNSHTGLHLSYHNYTTIMNNNISNHFNGMEIRYSHHNTITKNEFTNCGNLGCLIQVSSSYNIFVLNNFITNLGFAILMNNDTTTIQNAIHHNNFIDNNLGFIQCCEDGSNIWFESSTSEGNYWSDWTEGVYVIDGVSSSMDMFPLSSPIDIYLTDTDNDGMDDNWELANGLNPLVDDSALDLDTDGLTNLQEYLLGTYPNDNDSDSDGLLDGDEVNIYNTNPLTTDTDADSMPDGWEVANGLNPLVDDSNLDPDSDDLQNLGEFLWGTDPNDSDSDSDGLQDFYEINFYFTNPTNPDTDGDGLGDGDEVNIHFTDPNNNDTDSDNLDDYAEIYTFFTDPLNSDSDSDGLSDYSEVHTYSTNPLDSDSDDDGYLDGWEVLAGTDPKDENSVPSYVDLDGDNMDDFWEMSYGLNTSIDDSAMDLDSDGLTNLEEYQHSTNPNSSDSDSDGLNDGEEVNTYLTDPNDSDTDSDGLSDGDEVNLYETSPINSDTDGDGLTDSDEISIYSTDPTDSDSDNDDLTDYQEIFITFTQPNSADSDSDGLNDGEEVNTYLTDPNDSDTDSDGLSDGDEVNFYLTNPTDPDTDGDGRDDGWEIQNDQNPISFDNYLNTFEIILYYAILPLIVLSLVTLAVVSLTRSRKRRVALRRAFVNIQRNYDKLISKEFKVIFTNISTIFDLTSSIDRINQFTISLSDLTKNLNLINSSKEILRKSEIDIYEGVLHSTKTFFEDKYKNTILETINLITIENLDTFTNDLLSGLAHNWSEKGFIPVSFSYDKLVSFLSNARESGKYIDPLIESRTGSAYTVGSSIVSLAENKSVLVQDYSKKTKTIVDELTPIFNNPEINDQKLDRLSKIKETYSKIEITKLKPLVEFEDKGALKAWLSIYSLEYPHRIEGDEIIFEARVEGVKMKDDMTTAIDELLSEFSNWEETGKGKKA